MRSEMLDKETRSVVIINPGEFTSEAERPRVVTEPRISTPSIVILLGSTAALSALELMRHMLTLRIEDRQRVALVYIDTDEPSASLVEFRHQYNGVFQEFPLRIAVPAGISYGGRIEQDISKPQPVGGAAAQGANPNPFLGNNPSPIPNQPLAARAAAQGANPNPYLGNNPGPTPNQPKPTNLRDQELHTFIIGKQPQYFSNGAGGIRNNGHVAACFHHQAIYDTLNSALTTIARIDSASGGRRINEVQVNIVAFLGGGTGSGILPDVAVMVRDLLTHFQYRQRINMFCMLPEPIREASQTDLSWRKSNSSACLLEILAYSMAAAKTGIYKKYMREKVYLLTNDPIANEIYLIGHSAMSDVMGTARIVGLDLFQRITDASGAGFLEHSKWVDRRTLGETDDRGLPTMFGTSCPLELSFPAEETADAFACISAAQLLPLLASYQPMTITARDADKRDWERKWDTVARIDADPNNPLTIKPAVMNFDEFIDADQVRLNILWARLERYEQETEQRIKEVIARTRKEEFEQIDQPPVLGASAAATSLLNVRINQLQRLQQEYTHALEMFSSKETPYVPQRPVELEASLIQPGNWFSRLRSMGRDYATDVHNAYNEHIDLHAQAARQRLLEQLLRDLLQHTRETLNSSLTWLKESQVNRHQQELDLVGKTSMAWQGRLDYDHPHQQHIFDLRPLRSGDGRNIAVERLYIWATGGDKALNEGTPIEYEVFVNRCVDYLTRKMNDPRVSSRQSNGHIESYSAGRLADRVVDFFHDFYMEQFRDRNLFELFEKAAPPSAKGQPRSKQLSDYFLEHLQNIRSLMSSLIAFEAELWSKGSTTLDTSIFLGIHWRDGYQRGILTQALNSLGPLTSRGQSAMVEAAIDPHRLQLIYGQHAISLSTVADFYQNQNSAMADYLAHQAKWEGAGSEVFGYMPVHSCSEAQWLVRDPSTLGYQPPTPLYQRVIRKPFGA
jgi:hypothetical protein